MLYEFHLTTTPDADVDKWVALCRGLGIKPLVIELEAGSHPRQVMTAARHEGDDGSADAWRGGLVAAFDAAGFPVLREKLEVPLDKAAPYDMGGYWGREPVYHEAHVKMLLAPGEQGLADAASAGQMYCSRNALVLDDFGRRKWYLTQRADGGTRYDAAQAFAESFAEVTAILPAVRMEMETVIFDSNPDLDEGWAA